ncbi:MAG: hypothetical protein C4K49_10220 [Candidatus Thorarchaeota archaeon]|nr:MAG: hypothetical protein C4K49_10220 [Candidatus Thorarchaeota archaeon]
MPMLRTSSEAFPASRDMISEIPYVLRVEFRDLARDVTKITGIPITCHKCNGFLMSADQIVEDRKVGKHFVCPFCGTLNMIAGEVVLAGSDTDFIIKPGPDKTETTTTAATTAGGRSFLAVIDVSGSMAGANLAAVKRSLTTSVESLAANSPDTLFGLIEFESSVLFRNMETGEAVQLPRESFASFETITEAARRLMDRIKLIKVGGNAGPLKRHINALREQGGTALGPAVAMACVIAKHRGVGRVVLLTDGLANEGIGALEGYQVTPGNKYYEDLGRLFKDNGTAIDVVGIATGAGMELKTLGLMPEATGGQMYYVTPNELDKSLSELAGASLLGRDVQVRLLTPSGVKVKDASGVSRAVVDELRTKSESRIGVVGENHELYFEVEPESTLKAKEVPIQVQVEYTDQDGSRRMRTFTKKLQVTSDEKELVKTMDPTIGATFVVQKAGEEALGGGRAAGMSRIASYRAAMKKKAKAAPAPVQAKLQRADDALATEEENMERQEAAVGRARAGAPSAAADQAVTENLAQMRKASKALFGDEEDEK